MTSRQPKTPNASGGMARHNDRMLRIARAVAAQHEPTSAELKLARHMAQDGARIGEIQTALGWNCCVETCINRLRKFNIFVRVGRNSKGKLAKYGGNTGVGSRGNIDMRSYRPNSVERGGQS